MIAATDTLRDRGIPEGAMLADTRPVWGPVDMSGGGKPRVTKRPA